VRFRRVAVGGTFSLLHAGHRHLLRVALSMASESLVVGVSSDEFVKTLGKKHEVEPYEVRALRVLRYCLRKAGSGQHVTVVPLDDPAGPVSEDPHIEALVATEETLPNAVKVIGERARKGLPPVTLVVVEPLLDSSGVPLSATRIWHSAYQGPRDLKYGE